MERNAKLLVRYDCHVLYEDDTVLALSKPAGLLVLPDRFDATAPNLYHILSSLYPSVFVVHRLDKETSGVLLFAKTAETHAALSSAFEHRTIEKQYLALVEGTPNASEATITLPLREVRGKAYVHPDGKESVTTYRVREQFRGFAFLEVLPLTGRLHQIRAHFKAIHMPILCDPLYGTRTEFFLSSIKHPYRGKETERPLLARTALHAFRISFEHPVTHQRISLESSLPKDMKGTLQALRKYAGAISSNKF